MRSPAPALSVLLLFATPVRAAIDPAKAAATFAEAKAISDRDGGKFWGRPLYGPILLVDPESRAAAGNLPDGGSLLTPVNSVFEGTLPKSENISNSPMRVSGRIWTELFWPIYGDDPMQHVSLAHEMFHRVQIDLGLPRSEGDNGHLDSFVGRYFLQLEWRALAKALTDPADRKVAIADALLFRRERYRLLPGAAENEATLERNEGMAEYTGVRLGLDTPGEQRAYAVRDLRAQLSGPSFVRSFAYATGPAYGLLLDPIDPDWRRKMIAGARFNQLLTAAAGIGEPMPGALDAAQARYDGAGLKAIELAREADRQKRLAIWQAKLVDGPVLIVPTRGGNRSFKPQELQPLRDLGTVYPTMRLSAEWGVLEVSDAALLDSKRQVAMVSAAGASAATRKANGWVLTLNPGWGLFPGERPGDLVVRRADDQAIRR